MGDATSDTLTINASTKIVNDDKFYIQSVNNGGASNTGVGISFSDHVTAGSRQVGEINYKHEDLLSPEANYSDTFTYLVSRYEDVYDHQGNPFNNLYGTFETTSDPLPAIFVDDLKTTEPSDAGATPSAETLTVSLSKVQGSDVTFDYSVSSTKGESAPKEP